MRDPPSLPSPSVIASCAARLTSFPFFSFLFLFAETEQMLWILDLKGSNRKCFPPKAVCKEALNIFYTHYPERCLTPASALVLAVLLWSTTTTATARVD